MRSWSRFFCAAFLLALGVGATPAAFAQWKKTVIIVEAPRIDDANSIAGTNVSGSQVYSPDQAGDSSAEYVAVASTIDTRCLNGSTTVTSRSARQAQLDAMQAANDAMGAFDRALNSNLGRAVQITYADGGSEQFIPSYSGAPSPVPGTLVLGNGVVQPAPSGACTA